MPTAPVPQAEAERLTALRRLRVLDLDTDIQRELAPLLRLAAFVARAEHAVINLIDSDRQCQIAPEGPPSEVTRAASMCAHVVAEARTIWTQDASTEERFADNPFVTGTIAHVRFYAGIPLRTMDGHVVGTLCLFDEDRRSLTTEQLDRLHDIAAEVAKRLEAVAPPPAPSTALTDAVAGPRKEGRTAPSPLQADELRAALKRDELVLMYQPKVDLVTGRSRSVEALIRWRHPTRGLVFPDAFIPLAEQEGLIGEVTVFTLRAALEQCTRWQREGHFLNVAVNLSPEVLDDDRLVEEVTQLLRSAGIPASSLALEVTESAAMADPVSAIRRLGTISRMGIEIAIDDFGTGYSSLVYLRDLPASAIKIDKRFVMAMTQNEHDAAIVRAAIELAHSLGKSVVAEGVEDEATLTALRQLGCELGQGYHWSRAVPANEVLDFIKSVESNKGHTVTVRPRAPRVSAASWRAYVAALQALVVATRVEDVRGAVHSFVDGVGGSVTDADTADPDLIPIDLSFGGSPVVAAAPRRGIARGVLEQLLPDLLRHAQQTQLRLEAD